MSDGGKVVLGSVEGEKGLEERAFGREGFMFGERKGLCLIESRRVKKACRAGIFLVGGKRELVDEEGAAEVVVSLPG